MRPDVPRKGRPSPPKAGVSLVRPCIGRTGRPQVATGLVPHNTWLLAFTASAVST
jgi:hypothetical protein